MCGAMKTQSSQNVQPINNMWIGTHQGTISPNHIKSKFHISLNMLYRGQGPNESKIIPRSADETCPSPFRSIGPPISPN